MSSRHPWLLLGPRYRWPDPDRLASGRTSAPALQAFASPGFVDEFLREPQRSLRDRSDDHEDGTRKLFLAGHRRFYIVACELHCNAPGLPPVTRDQVCEAGFVIRRHRIGTMFATRYARGWIPDREHPGTGAWIEVDPTPHTHCLEQTHRLFPLAAPPGDPTHTGHGRTIFFGAIPTGSADLDAEGKPQLEPGTTLELRCFVRRHRSSCPRRTTAPDCHGELIWSGPSEPFRIAAPLDNHGIRHDPAVALGAARQARLRPWLDGKLDTLALDSPTLSDDAITAIAADPATHSDLSPPLKYHPRRELR